MSYSDRDDLPHFKRSKLGLHIDAGQVVDLAVDAQRVVQIRFGPDAAPARARPVFQHELAAADSFAAVLTPGGDGGVAANWTLTGMAADTRSTAAVVSFAEVMA